MNTQPSPKPELVEQDSFDVRLDLQVLLDQATACLQAGDIATARDQVEMAWLLHHETRLEPILQGLENALADSHQQALACLDRAEQENACGNLEAAEGLLRQANEMAPDSPLLLNALAWFLVRRGDLSGAQVAYMDVLRLRPRSAQAHANLAGVCLQRGLLERSETLLLRTLELDPAHPQARLALEQVRRARPVAPVAQEWSVRTPSPDGMTETVWVGFSFLPLLG
jgi:tetratricopeptide (TPR) repeat protein